MVSHDRTGQRIEIFYIYIFLKKTKHFSFIYKTGLNCNTDGSFCGGDLKNGSKYIKYMEWNVMREILKYFSNERNISRCIYKRND